MLATDEDRSDFAASRIREVNKLARAVSELASDIDGNSDAAAALAHHVGLVAKACTRKLGEGFCPDVIDDLVKLEVVLERVKRLLVRTRDKNELLQLLVAGKTADAIRGLETQLVQLQQTLQLAVDAGQDSVAMAIAADKADLPRRLAQLMAAVDDRFDVQHHHLETLQAIGRHGKQLIAMVPERRRHRLAAVLEATKRAIIEHSGRDLSQRQDWSVDPDDVEILWHSMIGEGGFGQIFRGEWNGKTVAVKVIIGARGREAIAEIEREAAVWFPLRDPGVLPLWRVCLNTDRPFIVMPLMHSDVETLLSRNPQTPVEVRTHFLLGTARGMQYLHERLPPIIHGDIKANNILVGDDGDVRITDFGLAFIKASSSAHNSRTTSALRWTAPELLTPGSRLEKSSDVFSFAMTAAQILTGEVPFVEERNDAIVVEWIKDGERPDRPSGIADVLWQIIDDCWHQDPAARPTFRQVALRLGALPHAKPQLTTSANNAAVARKAAQRLEMNLLALRTPTHDTSCLVRAFPDWCARKDITPANAQLFNGSKREQKFLGWEDGRLAELRLIDQNIRGPLTPLIGDFVDLRLILLNNNKITELPSSIGRLHQLVELCDNHLSALPDALCDLPMLQILRLKSNRLTALPQRIGNLSELTFLDIYDNQLESVPESLGSLEKLVDL
ncbi:hypothetical protein HK105_202974 [Polyrhizophydium stewartii]|uniref:Protein kinase domain-containing protein n=1 Tax=Polyrhizophydium stewartii TaxID=2732419 RepID=A0ABR4NCS8_9FUNG